MPIVLLWLAIDRRISAYAWTEQRIYLVALASAITIAYAILIILKFAPISFDFCRCNDSYFAMTWVGETKEIAYQSQKRNVLSIYSQNLIYLMDKENS